MFGGMGYPYLVGHVLDWWQRVEEPLFYVEVPRNITILEMKTRTTTWLEPMTDGLGGDN
jgi:hypothetical protein